jgi:hypothetical protein
MTGYEGSEKAADYIYSLLSQWGLDPVVQRYKLVVPVDEGATLIIHDGSNTTLKAFSVWPNGVQTSPTPPQGLRGKLIYAGSGRLEEFDGKDVEGSIVLMEFTSGDGWLNAAKLGAKAVIFTEPNVFPSYYESIKKFLDTPLRFTRVYVKAEDSLTLKRAADRGLEVTVKSEIRYKEVEGKNIIGVSKGESDSEIIILSSHYDSWSSIPALAMSSNEAVSSSFLLEVARYMSQNAHYRTIWFVFFSGHWQALAGAREFVEEYYFSPEVVEGRLKPLMLLNIGDIDSEGKGLQLLRGSDCNMYGVTSGSGGITLRYEWIRKKIFTEYLVETKFLNFFRDMTGVLPTSYVREYFTNYMYWGTEPFPYMLDSEPAEQTRGVAFTIQSSFTSKQWIGTPIGDIHLIREENLRPQLLVLTHLIESFVNEREWGLKWQDIQPTRIFISPGGISQYAGFITLNGKVLTYNLSAGWYKEVRNALVRVYVGGVGPTYSPYPYPFNKFMTFSDINGTFTIHGLSPYPFIPSGRYIVEAWKLNPVTNEIEYAPDLGIYGARVLRPFLSPLMHPDQISVVIMRAFQTTIFDVLDPRTMRLPMIPDPRVAGYVAAGGGWFHSGGAVVVPQDFNTRGDPLFYGVYYNGYEPVACVFMLPKSKFSILLRLGGITGPVSGRPALVLVNSTEERPEGYGLTSSAAPLVITRTAYQVARDMFLLTKHRYEILGSQNVRSLSVEEKLNTAEELLRRSEEYYGQKLYSKAYPLYLAAWSWAYRAYNDEVMPLIDDSAKTSLFFFALIIPTALFVEKLTVHSEGRRRLLYVILTGLFLVLLFTLVHPAIRIMNNSVMGLMGVLSMLIFVLTLVILGEETERIMREISYRLLGYHRVEVGRIGLAMTSFSTALENMRKRKIRTLLTLATVVSIALAITALTSVSSYVLIKRPSIPYAASYDGLMLKIGFGAPPDGVLQPYLVNVLEGLVEREALILPRVFYYPQSIGPNLGVVAQISPVAKTQQNITSSYRGMLGLTSEDSYVLLGEAMREGRNFTKWEYFSCILPKSMAGRLNVTYGDIVVTLGMHLKVVGVFDDGVMNMTRELDNMMPLPMDPLYFTALGLGYQAPAQQTPPQLLWSSIIVVPYRLALDLGGYVGQISIRFSKRVSQVELTELADRIALSTDVNVYVGYNGTVRRSSRVAAFSLSGWEVVPAIVVIGALNVAVTLIGNVKERTKDMFIYSAVGLSPFGAMLMFVIETAVYAFVGVIAGYFLGFVLNAGLISLNILPPNFTFNYASVFAILSLSIVIVAAMASSLYPASIASRMITPSLERRWKPATKPKGEEWEVPLPLSLPTLEEAAGFIEYLNEYYEGAGAQKSTFTVREIRNLSTVEPSIELFVALSPYEMAITQSVKIRGFKAQKEQRFDFNIYMRKLTGPTNVWAVTSYYFVDDLRKQALLWRSLTAEEHRKYIERALS